tara:strand:- start:2465 stop:2842 length:378 start_codon:yes stop_codon:yes gene_type:complete
MGRIKQHNPYSKFLKIMANSAFNARFRVVDNNSSNQNAPEKNLIIDFDKENAKKAAMWLMQEVDKVDENNTTIRVYTDKSSYDEVPGFSLWGGMWGNSGRIQPLDGNRVPKNQPRYVENNSDIPF